MGWFTRPVRANIPVPIRVGRGGSHLIPGAVRPRKNSIKHGLPDPNSDWPGYLFELRERLRSSVEKFAIAQAHINALDDYHISGMGNELEGDIRMNQDREVKRLASKRESAARRITAYSQAIRTEIMFHNTEKQFRGW